MDYFTPIAIGFLAGYLSGQFGIGGGFLMQPALRLIIGTPALISLGTPIPVIVVAATTGTYNYFRSGFVDLKMAAYLAVFGLVGSVLGSLATAFIEGDLLLFITALVLMLTSSRFILGGGQKQTTEKKVSRVECEAGFNVAVIGVGIVAGFLAGLLGLGGGFLLVPALTFIFNKDIKTALGTSLLVIIAYSIPASITHYLLGHVNLLLAMLLVIGIIPGAYIGSRVAIGLPEHILRRLFGIFLFSVALYFAIFEARILLGG